MSSEGRGAATTRWSSRVLEIGGYTTVDVLGEHDATCTVTARPSGGGDLVVLVVLDPKMVRHDAQVDAFRVRAEAAQGLRHPNLAGVLEVGVDPDSGLHYAVCEHVDGRSLAALLDEQGSLPEGDAVAIAQIVCEALATAEEAGLAHGHLDAEAVLIDGDNTPRLQGLGVHHTGGSSSASRVATDAAQFVAPEAGRSVGSGGVRADLYAVGVLLYRMLTGGYPFSADSLQELAELHRRNELPDPRSSQPDVSAGTVGVLRGLAAKDPQARYPSARAAALDLVRVMTGQEPAGPSGAGAPDTNSFRLGERTAIDGAAAGAIGDSAFWGKGKAYAYKVILSSREVALDSFVFNKDVVTIGRSPRSDLPIDNPIVSRRHAQIRRDGTTFTLVALSETNSTSLNGERVRGSVPLQLGDTIVLSEKFRLRLEWAPGAAAAAEERDLSEVDTASWRDEGSPADAAVDVDDPYGDPAYGFAAKDLDADPGEENPYADPASATIGEETDPYGVSRDPAHTELDDDPYGPPPPARPTAEEPARAAAPAGGAPAEPAGDLTPAGGVTDLGGRAWVAPRGYLVYEREGTQVRSFVDRGFQVGRSPACDLRLGAGAPRKAALIVRCSDGYRLFNVCEDASLVQLNGEPVPDQAVLQHGDRLGVAGVRLLFNSR